MALWKLSVFCPNYQFSVKIINPSKNSYRLRVGCIEVVKKTYRCCFGCTEVVAKKYRSRVGSMEVGTDHTHSRLLELPRLLWLKSFRFSRSANNSPSLPAQWPNACTTQPPSTPSASTRHAAHRAPARLHSKASQWARQSLAKPPQHHATAVRSALVILTSGSLAHEKRQFFVDFWFRGKGCADCNGDFRYRLNLRLKQKAMPKVKLKLFPITLYLKTNWRHRTTIVYERHVSFRTPWFHTPCV